MKHLATSLGIGAAEGSVSRGRKSPVGVVRWKTIVLLLGVLIPEIGFGAPGWTAKPLITV